MADVARFVRDVPAPALTPPISALGPIAWARANLFSSAASSCLRSGLPGRQMRLRKSVCDLFPFVCDLVFARLFFSSYLH